MLIQWRALHVSCSIYERRYFCKRPKISYTVNTMEKDADERVYVDAGATTPVGKRVLAAMGPLWQEAFANAGSIHREGVRAKDILRDARATCAKILHAHSDEIIFTSGGTESNNLAIMGTVLHRVREQNDDYSKIHIVTSAIEHASVLEVCREIERRGARVSYVPVDEEGQVLLAEMKKAVTSQTMLVSIMFANNEIGTMQPIREIAKIVRNARKQNGNSSYPYFHTDAAQALTWSVVSVEKLGVDFVSVDGHKIYGPKGVGLLYVRRGIHIAPLFYGGAQEGGMRPGTEPLPLIVGLAKALEIAESEREYSYERMSMLREHFVTRLKSDVPRAEIHGGENVLRNIVNISVPGIESDVLVIALDERGIACSSRSACHSSDDSSYVIAALGKGIEFASSALRFSFLKTTTREEIDKVVSALAEVVAENVRKL